jgi:ribosome-binding factor A
MQSVRVQRVRELLRRQLGEIVRREPPPAPGVLVTVNDVDLARDLKSATVYIGVIGPRAEQARTLAHLTAERPRIQELLASAVVLKHTPRLRFELDDSVERGNRVLAVMDELERNHLPPAP